MVATQKCEKCLHSCGERYKFATAIEGASLAMALFYQNKPNKSIVGIWQT